MDLAERLWSDVEKTDGGCWEWMGSRLPKGYGNLTFQRRHLYAHRAAWEVTYGPIPEGMWVCHKCDNPPCTNPDHLFLGTVLENTRDMIAKGRARLEAGPDSVRKVGPEGTAWCGDHHEYLPVDRFTRSAFRWNGLMNICRDCHAAHERERRRYRKGLTT